jgi:hypothetical protein
MVGVGEYSLEIFASPTAFFVILGVFVGGF